jgi:hypothetical protein
MYAADEQLLQPPGCCQCDAWAVYDSAVSTDVRGRPDVLGKQVIIMLAVVSTYIHCLQAEERARAAAAAQEAKDKAAKSPAPAAAAAKKQVVHVNS